MGRVSRFQREWMRERRRHGNGNLHRFSVQHPNKIELSPARESQRVQLRLWAVMLGCWGWKWEKEWEGEVACGYLTGEAVSVACRDGHSVLGVHWPGWAVAL
jgi:hypothetical protein